MKKQEMIWVVVSDCVYKACEEEPQRMAFRDKESALVIFKKWCDENRAEFGANWECEEGDYYQDMWLEGSYLDNHARIVMEQIPLM